MISKIIHQTAPRDETKWNPIWKECQSSWKKNFSEFEYIFWDDDDIRNLIKTDYPQYLKEYDSFKYHIIRIDFARSCILHKHGGIYADMDFYCYQNFYEFLLKNKIYLVESWPEWKEKVQNSLMISPPKQNFWIEYCDTIICNMKKINYDVKNYRDVLNYCGPICLSNLITGQIRILPKELFNPKIKNQFNWANNNYESIDYHNALKEFKNLNSKNDIFTRHYLTGIWCDTNGMLRY